MSILFSKGIENGELKYRLNDKPMSREQAESLWVELGVDLGSFHDSSPNTAEFHNSFRRGFVAGVTRARAVSDAAIAGLK